MSEVKLRVKKSFDDVVDKVSRFSGQIFTTDKERAIYLLGLKLVEILEIKLIKTNDGEIKRNKKR